MTNYVQTIFNACRATGSTMVLAARPDAEEIKTLLTLGIVIEEDDEARTVARNTGEVADYFKATEFACPCCGTGVVNSKVHKALNLARAIAGVPFVITSGYRCRKHNAEVGGSETSSHMKRYAVDIKADNSSDRYAIIGGLIHAGFNRVGIAENFIHADMDPNKASEVIWLY